jgi:hypothetical protein
MTLQPSLTDPPEDEPDTTWRNPSVRERREAAKALKESRDHLRRLGAKGVAPATQALAEANGEGSG